MLLSLRIRYSAVFFIAGEPPIDSIGVTNEVVYLDIKKNCSLITTSKRLILKPPGASKLLGLYLQLQRFILVFFNQYFMSGLCCCCCWKLKPCPMPRNFGDFSPNIAFHKIWILHTASVEYLIFWKTFLKSRFHTSKGKITENRFLNLSSKLMTEIWF